MDEAQKIKDFLAALRQMLDIYEGAETFEVAEEDLVRMAMLHGLLAHTLEMARAAITLVNNKQVTAAEVLTRVALEHAVFAQWAHQHPEGLDGLSKAEAITYGKLFNGLKDGFDFPQEVADFYEAKMQKPKNVPVEVTWFEGMCKSFVDGENLYYFYRLLSGTVHPGNLTGRQYRDYLVEGGSIRLRWHAQMADPIPVLYTLTLAVALVAWIYEDLRKGKPRLGEIQSIAALVEITTPLTLHPPKAPLKASSEEGEIPKTPGDGAPSEV